MRTLLRPTSCIALALLCSASTHAQFFRNSDYWKTHRKELSVGLGASNFLGELGGRDRIGSAFIWDLEMSQTKPAISVAYRYFLAEKMSLRGAATYGVLAGNDNLTAETFRRNRNLSFRSDIVEGQLVFEFHPSRERLGHLHDLRGVKGDTKAARIGYYGFLGIGVLYFDPRAMVAGEWVRLHPLNTEGQGLSDDAPDPYSRVTICIPMGVGVRKAITKELSLGLELQYTKTFSDYIDDVSGVYFDNDILAAQRGSLAAYLADPNLGEVPGQTVAGAQRGDPDDKDAYMFLRFQAHYKLFKFRTSNKKYRSRGKRQKVVF